MNFNLTVISSSEKAARTVCEILSPIIGSQFCIKGYCYKALASQALSKDDLFLITARSFTHLILPHLHPQSKYIIARRSIDPSNLYRLLQIPPHSEVLVVNDFVTTAYELIEEMIELDLPPMKYFPYDEFDLSDPYNLNTAYTWAQPTSRNPRSDHDARIGLEARYKVPSYSGKPFQYAITAGEVENVPEQIPHIIDLGERQISIMTIAGILYHFTGNAACDHLVSSRYMRGIVKTNLALSLESSKNNNLQVQLKAIISNFEYGILLVNDQNEVVLHNQMASEILSRESLIGHCLKDIFPKGELRNLLDSGFMQLDHHEFYATRKALELSSNEHYSIISIIPLANIQNIDLQYRKIQKHNSNAAKYYFEDIVHESNIMSKLISKASRFARTSSTILINGESGTGKELLAQAIHNASQRTHSPFVAINCGALTESLLESELFGYVEGAFTGAKKGGRRGLFEIAHTGTLFLDEIGDAPLKIQTQLLRALQEKEVMRVGGDKTIPVDVRIIAATNHDLCALIHEGRFRQDLYYRLNVLPLQLPPLRDRKQDIPAIFKAIIKKLSHDNLCAYDQLNHDAIISILQSHSWPGNIRELENAAEYLISTLDLSDDLHRELRGILKLPVQREDSGSTHPSAQVPCALSLPMQQPGLSLNKNTLIQIFFPNKRFRSECVFILEVLRQAQENESGFMGRGQIQLALETKGIKLSLQQVKSRLAYLSSQGLVHSTVGVGSSISNLGIQFLMHYKSQDH